jgi:hypothetical protein
MVVYFSAFIPFYAGIAAPLFALLQKGSPWWWGAEEEHTFQSAKIALMRAPIRGHPIQGWPYRLYTDACDEALGCALQQIQPIRVANLKGTRAYKKLKAAFEKGLPVPRLVGTIKSKVRDDAFTDEWSDTLDDSTVHVERVIAYYSRSFTNVERHYSTTEREALGAKEGLVKFQPYIEGENILLVMDHSVLQWAHTYENSNRCLVTWGAIYSAYAPGLEIIHCPGRVHSNVDPLSRLPRSPPKHTSPIFDNSSTLRPDSNAAAAHKQSVQTGPARMATVSFAASHISECLAELPLSSMDLKWATALSVQTCTGRTM